MKSLGTMVLVGAFALAAGIPTAAGQERPAEAKEAQTAKYVVGVSGMV